MGPRLYGFGAPKSPTSLDGEETADGSPVYDRKAMTRFEEGRSTSRTSGGTPPRRRADQREGGGRRPAHALVYALWTPRGGLQRGRQRHGGGAANRQHHQHAVYGIKGRDVLAGKLRSGRRKSCPRLRLHQHAFEPYEALNASHEMWMRRVSNEQRSGVECSPAFQGRFESQECLRRVSDACVPRQGDSHVADAT